MKELDNGRILVGGTGVGKSLTAAAYAVAREPGRDIYVITTAKKRESGDWEKEFAHFGIARELRDPGRTGALHVDSWNNIGKYEGVEDAFFIFDEQRLVGTGAWTKSFYKIAKRNRWILLSATPGDTWLDYAPVFIANGWYKNISAFKEEHVVYAPYVKFPKVIRYNAAGKLVRYRNQIQVQMPYLRHTTRKITWKHVEYRQDLVEEATKNRWNPLEQRPLKDVAELFRVVRKVTNTDASRLEAVRQLSHVHPRLIVFYSFDYELDILRTLLHPSSEDPLSTLSRGKDGLSLSTSGNRSSTFSPMRGLRGFPDDQTSQANDSLLRIGSTQNESSSDKEEKRSWHGEKLSNPTEEYSTNYSDRSPSSLVSRTGATSSSRIERSTKHGLSTGSSPTPSEPFRNGSTSGGPATPSSSQSQEAEWTSDQKQKNHPSSRPPSKTTERSTSSRWNSEEPSSNGTGTTPSPEAGTGPTQNLSELDQTATAPDVSYVGSAEGIYSDTLIAEWNGHRHDPVPTGDRWVYLVQYTAGSEGWNCTTTDAMIFWSIPYSYKQWHQAFGRIDRMNTPYSTLYYYVLFSKSWIDQAIRRSLMAKKNFNESASGVSF